MTKKMDPADMKTKNQFHFKDVLSALNFLQSQQFLSAEITCQFYQDVYSGFWTILIKEKNSCIDIGKNEKGFYFFEIKQVGDCKYCFYCNNVQVTHDHFDDLHD